MSKFVKGWVYVMLVYWEECCPGELFECRGDAPSDALGGEGEVLLVAEDRLIAWYEVHSALGTKLRPASAAETAAWHLRQLDNE